MRGERTYGSKNERAVVVTLTVAVADVVPFSAREFGEMEQVEARGVPLQVSDTVRVIGVTPAKLSV